MHLASYRQTALPAALVPVHVEAYPSFNIETVQRRWREDVRRCEWHDEDQGIAGQMELKAWAGPTLLIHYSCGRDTYRRQRGADFTVVMHPQISRRVKPRVFCPECNTIKLRLSWRGGRWACQQCHGLVERRMLLDPIEKAVTRRDRLYGEVHARSKPVRSLEAFERKRYEMMELESVLGNRTVTRLAPPLVHEVTPVWLGSEDEEHEPQPQETTAYLDARSSIGPRG